MSNTQNMATVYYLGGIKNDLSNQWNSLLNIQNLASACSEADKKIVNDEFYAGGNILRESNSDVTIDDAGSGNAVGDLLTLQTDGDDAYYIVQSVDEDGGIESLLLVSGTEDDTIDSNANQTTSGSGSFTISGIVSPNNSGISYTSENLSGFATGDYVQLTGSNTGSGAQITVTAVDSDGGITGQSVTAGGTGYSVGDIIHGDSDASGKFAVFTVDTVDSTTGEIQTVNTTHVGVGYSANEIITLRETGGQAAIYSVHVYSINGTTHTFLRQVYGGLDFNVSDTITVQTNGDGNPSDLSVSVTSVESNDVNIGSASYYANYWAGEISDSLRLVNGASTSVAYVSSLADNGALANAITNWSYGIRDCLQSLMLSMTDTSPSIYDKTGTQLTLNTTLSSASVAPYMFNAADDQTQVGIMMKNKALGDYGDFLQNQARAWNMLLANLTYGPTTMFNINSVNPFISQLNNLGNAINAFCNELDIVYVQIRSGTYSVANNAANLQQSYNSVVSEVSGTASELNTLREALTK